MSACHGAPARRARAVNRSATRNASRRGRPALSQPAAARPTRRSSSASRALNASPSDGSHGELVAGDRVQLEQPTQERLRVLAREVAALDECDGVREICERQPASETRAMGTLGRIGRRHELARGAAAQPPAPPHLRPPSRRTTLPRAYILGSSRDAATREPGTLRLRSCGRVEQSALEDRGSDSQPTRRAVRRRARASAPRSSVKRRIDAERVVEPRAPVRSACRATAIPSFELWMQRPSTACAFPSAPTARRTSSPACRCSTTCSRCSPSTRASTCELELAPEGADAEVAAAGAALGEALAELFGGDVRGYGSATLPADEALAHVTLEASGRPLVVSNVDLSDARVGGLGSDLLARFLHELGGGSRADAPRPPAARRRRAPRARGDLQGARRRSRAGLRRRKDA